MELSERYDLLMFDIQSELRSMIKQSTTKSKYYDGYIVKVDINSFTELGIINNHLALIDNNGNLYSIFVVDITDLIHIIEKE